MGGGRIETFIRFQDQIQCADEILCDFNTKFFACGRAFKLQHVANADVSMHETALIHGKPAYNALIRRCQKSKKDVSDIPSIECSKQMHKSSALSQCSKSIPTSSKAETTSTRMSRSDVLS